MIAQDEGEARAALNDLLVERRFGTERVVVEEHLDRRGAVAAGAVRRPDRALPLASAQDYKRIFDGDRGPNTGGMGSYSPVPAVGRGARARRSAPRSTSRCSTSCAAAASRSTACCTPG